LIEDGNNSIQVVLVEIVGFDIGHRADAGLALFLLFYLLCLGQVQCCHRSLKMEI